MTDLKLRERYIPGCWKSIGGAEEQAEPMLDAVPISQAADRWLFFPYNIWSNVFIILYTESQLNSWRTCWKGPPSFSERESEKAAHICLLMNPSHHSPFLVMWFGCNKSARCSLPSAHGHQPIKLQMSSRGLNQASTALQSMGLNTCWRGFRCISVSCYSVIEFQHLFVSQVYVPVEILRWSCSQNVLTIKFMRNCLFLRCNDACIHLRNEHSELETCCYIVHSRSKTSVNVYTLFLLLQILRFSAHHTWFLCFC